jgi:hypothetical protein
MSSEEVLSEGEGRLRNPYRLKQSPGLLILVINKEYQAY